jgi:cytoskeletal protein RodZ
MRALGEEFRAAREARGLSLSDVAEQIHIRSVYLQALENEDWSAIGAPVYTRGFIRTYARFLGLDPESAVQRFNEGDPAAGGAPPPPAGPSREPALDRGERRAPSLFLYLAATLALVLVAAVAYNFYSLQLNKGNKAPGLAVPLASATAQSVPSAAPSAAEAEATAESSPTVKPTKTLTLKLANSSWLRVLIDGQNVMEGVFPQGTIRTFHGSKALVRIGNAGGVDVDVNGKSLGKLGNDGDVIERVFVLAGE